ncbi:MAG: redoxin domain-containing protein [Planctomyces sp.]|nr:redoxin domain-containing protein [Planctomyces sp.]
MKWVLLTTFMMLMVLLSSLKSHEAQESAAQITAVATDFSVTDLQGVVHHLGQNDRECVRVFVFLSTTCPIANSYLQELDRLNESLPAGVELYGVVSDPFVTRQKAVSHFALMKVKVTVLFDGSGLLSKALKPTHVPEAFVIDRRNQLAYRGAIDNAYVTIGRRRTRVEQHYLNDAVRAAVANQPVLIPSTKPVGCQFPELSSAEKTGQVTYARHIAPMLQSRCLNCHREGQVAPFSLASYADALAHSKMLVEVTQRRIMPPWIPGQKSQRKFVGDRRLTERELEILSEWAADGCPEGDPEDLPPTPEFTDGWQLGPPDLIVRMSEPFTVPADGPDLLQNFVLPVEIPEDKLVAAVEFHPGNRRVVHHAVLFLDDKGQARSLDAATKEPGYSSFGGPGFLPSGALGGWSVGNTARRLPNEMGRYLKKGSDLVVQVHYHPTGREESDQSEVGLYFVNKPLRESLSQPARLVGSIWMANYEMDIPAGEPSYRRSTTYTLPRDVILVGIVPHMHLLGKSMKVTATRPGSPPEVLIDVPDWNYNWQDEYYYERPFELSAGTTLTVEAAFDNSSENPSNPSLPPQRVTWGEETTDEMLFCFFLLTANRPEDLIHTIMDNLGHDLKQPRKDVSQNP